MKTTVARIERGFSNEYRTPYAYSVLACGHTASYEGQVGAGAECVRCDWQAKGLATLRAALADGRVTHSRVRGGIYGDGIHVYERDPLSPTGVRHLVTLDPTEEVNALLRGGLSPLSPTERR